MPLVTHRWGDLDTELLDNIGQLLLQIWRHIDLIRLQLDTKHNFIISINEFCFIQNHILRLMLTYSFSFLLLGDSGVRLDDPKVVKLPNQRQSTRLSCQLLVGAVFSSCNSCRSKKTCDL